MILMSPADPCRVTMSLFADQLMPGATCRNIVLICRIRETSVNTSLTSRAVTARSVESTEAVEMATGQKARANRRVVTSEGCGATRDAPQGRPLGFAFSKPKGTVPPSESHQPSLTSRRAVRRPEIRELTERVGVRTQSARWAVALGEKPEPVVDHVVGEHAAIRVLRGLRRVVGEHVGQGALLVDRRDGLVPRVTPGVAEQVDEHVDPPLAIPNRIGGVVLL